MIWVGCILLLLVLLRHWLLVEPFESCSTPHRSTHNGRSFPGPVSEYCVHRRATRARDLVSDIHSHLRELSDVTV